MGKGKDVVLIHGLGASVYIWRFVIGILARKYRVTALDLPGFGRSSKNKVKYDLDAQTKRLLEFLDILKIKNAHLVGSSMGGALALWLGRAAPERVKKIVAMAPATDSSLVKLPISLLHSQRKAGARFFETDFVKNKILSRVLYNKNLFTDENKKFYFEPYSGNPNAIYSFIEALRLIKDKRLPGSLRNLDKDVLLYYGKFDNMVPLKNMESLDKLLPSSQLFIDDRAGHHPMEDSPETVSKEVLAFLKS